MVFEKKRINGQYFTEYNPFKNDAFIEWATKCDIKNNVVLEPFAGSNNLIIMLQKMGFIEKFVSYDIEPKNHNVKFRDTIYDFPQGFEICVTNPPYLARNSATRRSLPFPDTFHDDLYKFSLGKCLESCKYVCAIIPASFLNAGLFRNRLSHYVLLNSKMFNDTEHPVCLSLFDSSSKDIKIYENEKYLGLMSEFEKKVPNVHNDLPIKFNEKNGNLGLLAIDNTTEPSIKFCEGRKINPEKVCVSSRSLTRILIDCDVEKTIKKLNDYLNSFREETHDLFLTPFKGLRKDNKYRRRLDFALARKFINEVSAC